MKRGLSGGLRGRAREAFLLSALIRSRKTPRVGRDEPRENRGPTRENDGRYIAIRCFHVFMSSRRTPRFVFCSYVGLTSRPFAVPRGVALQIPAASLVLGILGKRRFDAAL